MSSRPRLAAFTAVSVVGTLCAALVACSSGSEPADTGDGNEAGVISIGQVETAPGDAGGASDVTTTTTPVIGAADGGATDAGLVINGPAKNLSALGAKCDGSDDTLAVIAAVTGARNGAYTLVVDCPATLDIGVNIDRSIFIDNDTTIVFTGSGKFTVNNLFEPAFVIVNSSNITLTNWNVEYATSMPVSLNTDGYSLDGGYHSTPDENGSGQFNDVILSDWLTNNRHVVFADGKTHGRLAWWIGSVNVSSVFLLYGETSNVQVTGLNLYSAHTDQPADYVPMAVELGLQYRSNQTVTVDTPATSAANASQFYAAPTNVTFDNVTLDGIIMGFQGNTIGSTFSNIHVMHVSDLQDADGGNVGGIGQSFPPPHLFYLNYPFGGDPALINSGIKISNVTEVGPRMGGLRPGGGGYANSLKLGCNDCSVDGYTTNRKDGFMDVLDSDGLTVSNVTATYDSSFVDQYTDWPGWRWPGGGAVASFKNVSFSNVTLTDVAAVTAAGPVSNNTAMANTNITMTNVNVILQSWTRTSSVLPAWTGLAAGSEITFTLKAQGETQVLEP